MISVADTFDALTSIARTVLRCPLNKPRQSSSAYPAHSWSRRICPTTWPHASPEPVSWRLMTILANPAPATPGTSAGLEQLLVAASLPSAPSIRLWILPRGA